MADFKELRVKKVSDIMKLNNKIKEKLKITVK